MQAILKRVRELNRIFDVIAGISISFIVLLTVSDVMIGHIPGGLAMARAEELTATTSFDPRMPSMC